MPCESGVPPLRAAALASAVERELWTMVSTTHSGTFHRHIVSTLRSAVTCEK